MAGILVRSPEPEGKRQMGDRQNVRRFEFRRSRIKAAFNVDFIVDGEIFRGLCKDVNDAGIRAEFDGVIVPDCSGLLILRHRIGELRLEAEVVYVAESEVVFVFVFKTSSEHRMAVQFIDSIADHIAVRELQ